MLSSNARSRQINHKRIKMIHVDATMEISPESMEILAPMMRRSMAEAALEDGCLVFRFTADITSPNLFYMSELWESEAALKAHMQALSFQNMIGILLKHARIINMATRQGELENYDLLLPV
jgi:quinol monooxygenase YgiN